MALYSGQPAREGSQLTHCTLSLSLLRNASFSDWQPPREFLPPPPLVEVLKGEVLTT